MRSAHRIRGHVFQNADAVILQTIRQSCADSSMILMVAGTFDLDRLSIQKEAFVDVDLERPNTECDLLGISSRRARLNADDRGVKVRLLRRP